MALKEIKIWTALVSPMKENGDPDLDDFASLIHRQADAGNGILILGSTGEGLALSRGDKERYVKTASSLNIDVPVMAGVGGYNLREQIEWIEYCLELDVDAFLLVTPLYAKPNKIGQFEWFRSLLDAAGKPCMLYNVPSRTGSWLDVEAFGKLADHPGLYGLKEAGGSIERFLEYREAAPGVPIYSGDDGMTPYLALNGCEGLVSVAANLWPEATRRYLELCLEGRGQEVVDDWREPINAIFTASNPIPTKALLREKGLIKSMTLRPPLSDKDLTNMDRLRAADESINTWYKKIQNR